MSSKDNNPRQKQYPEPELMLNMKQPKTNKICAYIHSVKPSKEGTAYSYLLGRYPIQSLIRNSYILVTYHYDYNAILTETIRDREKTATLASYKKIHQWLTNCGCKPIQQKLDNKIS